MLKQKRVENFGRQNGENREFNLMANILRRNIRKNTIAYLSQQKKSISRTKMHFNPQLSCRFRKGDYIYFYGH